MKTETESQFFLSELSRVPLNEQNKLLLDGVARHAGGAPEFRGKKIGETHDVLALSQLAPPGRLRVEMLDLRTDLRAKLRLCVPVACMPPGSNGGIVVAREAVLRLTYREAAMRLPQPGYSYIQIESPLFVWLANVAWDPQQPLCLGATLPAGVKCSELVLLAYSALAMTSVMIDPGDAAGVMNAHAALWWQQPQNAQRTPLTRAPFLGKDEVPR
jgi:hypothetical protein